jgi:peptidoglycan/LPS O-acetylase OafA/YrhL
MTASSSAARTVAPAAPEPVRPDHRAFPALDGIRGLAILCVLGAHAGYWTGRYNRGLLHGAIGRLEIGVTFFFVLSGFLLFRPWLLAAAQDRTAPSLRVYFWRRGLRILPAYWCAVLLAFGIESRNRGALSPWDYVRHLLLIEIYRPSWNRPGLTQMWSLCAEAAFYLLLPGAGIAAMAWTRRFGWRPMHLVLGCAVIAAVSPLWYAYIHVSGFFLSGTANQWLPGYLDWFAAGMAMAVLSVHLLVQGPTGAWTYVTELGRHPLLCWTIAVALFSVVVTPVAGPFAVGLLTGGTSNVRNVLFLVIAVLVVWPAVFGRERITGIVLHNRVITWLGTISYSVFLLHLIVLDSFVMNILGYPVFHGSFFAVFVLTTALSLAAAVVSYRFVELPASRLRGRVRPATTTPPPGSRPRPTGPAQTSRRRRKSPNGARRAPDPRRGRGWR